MMRHFSKIIATFSLFLSVNAFADFQLLGASSPIEFGTFDQNSPTIKAKALYFKNIGATAATLIPSVSGNYIVSINRCSTMVSSGRSCVVYVIYDRRQRTSNLQDLGSLTYGSNNVSLKTDIILFSGTPSIALLPVDNPNVEMQPGQRVRYVYFYAKNTGRAEGIPPAISSPSNPYISIVINRCNVPLKPGRSCIYLVAINKNISTGDYSYSMGATQVTFNIQSASNIVYEAEWVVPADPNLPACAEPQTLPFTLVCHENTITGTVVDSNLCTDLSGKPADVTFYSSVAGQVIDIEVANHRDVITDCNIGETKSQGIVSYACHNEYHERTLGSGICDSDREVCKLNDQFGQRFWNNTSRKWELCDAYSSAKQTLGSIKQSDSSYSVEGSVSVSSEPKTIQDNGFDIKINN